LVLIPIVTALPLSFVVALISTLFGFVPFFAHLPILYLQCAAVMVCLVVMFWLAAPCELPQVIHAQNPKLLERLPPQKRGRLLRLMAQDHYVEIVTDRGRALVPMRFRDALAEVSGEAGIQTHRSHWAALHAVTKRCRQGNRSGLLLTDGSFVPVGRSFSKEVTAALGRDRQR